MLFGLIKTLNNLLANISILGSGWLGLSLANHFQESHISINISTRSEKKLSSLSSAGFSAFNIDLDSIDHLFDHSIQSFLSCSVLIINIPSKNIEGFKKLIDQIEISSINNVLFISSTSVYKESNSIITEDSYSDLLPCDLLTIEELFTNNINFDTTIIRFGGLVGYDRHPGKFIKNLRMINNPLGKINMIHRDDCINIIDLVIHNSCWSEIFNCVADLHPTRKDFYSAALKQLSLAPAVFADDSKALFKIISNQKVKSILDYQFIYPDLLYLLQQDEF
ncbi:MAG: NAD(P)-dependent oxidoreductase [Gammaproteobacteria bacterium]|nr:MAG: NAD(P)-dependent oxidoreductase [Gammaproteobacteria bacterium]